MPANTVVVARGTGRGWGNPFRAINPKDEAAVARSVEFYRRYLSGGSRMFDCGPATGVTLAYIPAWHHADDLKKALPGLRGKNLACWCPIGSPCHADVLLELANGPDVASPLRGNDLRLAIVTEIYQWKKCPVPADADGLNAGEVYRPAGKEHDRFHYPPKGAIHPAFHAPDFAGVFGLENAIRLARTVGLSIPVCEIPTSGEELAWLCLVHWRSSRGKS